MRSRVDVLNHLIRLCGYERYLEIGRRFGQTFKNVKAKVKESVDPYYKATHIMTSEAYWKSLEGADTRWDLVFIDGDHREECVEIDAEGAAKYLSPGGAIVFHDILPSKEMQQDETRFKPGRGEPTPEFFGGGWKVAMRWAVKPETSFRTLQSDHGCGVLFFYPENIPLLELPEELGWTDYLALKEVVLRPVDGDEMMRFIIRMKQCLQPTNDVSKR